MKLLELFPIMVLKIDLNKVKLRPVAAYDHFRQQLGVQIDTALSGSRTGQWIGGRLENKKIYLFFRVSDPQKAKMYILRLLKRSDMPSGTKIRVKGKIIKWRNYTLI